MYRKREYKHKRCKIYENINLAEPVRYSLINFHLVMRGKEKKKGEKGKNVQKTRI